MSKKRLFLFLREDPEVIIDSIYQLKKKTNIDNQIENIQKISETELTDKLIDVSMNLSKKIKIKRISNDNIVIKNVTRINNDNIVIKNVKRISNNNDYIKYKDYLEYSSVILIEENNSKYKIDFPNYNLTQNLYVNFFKNIKEKLFNRKLFKNVTQKSKDKVFDFFEINNRISEGIMSILNKDDILDKFKAIEVKNEANITKFMQENLNLTKILENHTNNNNIKKKFKEEYETFLKDHDNILGIKYVLILEKSSSSFFRKNNILKRNLIKFTGGGNKISWQAFTALGAAALCLLALFIGIALCLFFGAICAVFAVASIFLAINVYRSENFDDFKRKLIPGMPGISIPDKTVDKMVSNSLNFEKTFYKLVNSVLYSKKR